MKPISLCTLGLALAASASVAHSAALSGSVYCKKDVQFAARIDPDGDLSFGVSAWNEHGDNSFVFGQAKKRAGYWEFSRDLASPDERARCRLKIAFTLRKGASITADPSANCASDGGLGRVTLPAESYQGPVTVELDARSNFFEDPPALLGKGDCFKRNAG
jgi:hypothetical protein